MSTIRALKTLVLAASLASCSFLTYETVHGTGERVSQVRDVGAFERVAIAGSFEVDVLAGQTTSGEGPEVVLDSYENLLPYVETEVKGATLELRVREGYRISPSPQVSIRLGELRGVEIAGSAAVEATGLSGEGFAVEIAGSGNVRAAGDVGGLDIDIAGSGDVQMMQLRAREARVRIAGSGDVEVHAEDRLEVSIAGSGDVKYAGNPEVSQKVAGSGDISKVKAPVRPDDI